MITAAYTICKNEIKYLEKWLYYTKDFNYRVLLDTGSTDGTWEALQEAAKLDPNLIIEQKIFTPWKFNIARMYNLDMIPNEVEWALSPDMDEYFSINVLEEMQKTIKENPNVTNIATTRLDLYTKDVFVGPPHTIPTNKIHRRHDYIWCQPIYEHLWYKHHDIKQEIEIYNNMIYLVHDQDFKKQSRPELYIKMLKEEFEENPTNCWTLWFLLQHYYKEQDVDNFIRCALVFIPNTQKIDNKHKDVKATLENIYQNMKKTLDDKTLQGISNCLKTNT
jgi:glycosyltransferase involved in cell wall biosynthesis